MAKEMMNYTYIESMLQWEVGGKHIVRDAFIWLLEPNITKIKFFSFVAEHKVD